MKRNAIIVTLAVAFCFALGSLAQAGSPTPLTPGQAVKYLPNAYKGVSLPSWQWLQDGSDKAVEWQDWQANPRFALYDPWETPGHPEDDVVLDKETGLVWTRDAGGWTESHSLGLSYGDAAFTAYQCILKPGWRLPTIDELLSLARDESHFVPGPFINTDDPNRYGWWSSTTYESDNDKAWVVKLAGPLEIIKPELKTSYRAWTWPVRGH